MYSSDEAQTPEEIAALLNTRRRIAKIFFAKASLPFAFVTLFETDVIDDEIVDDDLLGAQPPHPLLG